MATVDDTHADNGAVTITDGVTLTHPGPDLRQPHLQLLPTHGEHQTDWWL